ncbi:hypothetical protein [Petroclostridium sp. X23]|uniref:hypothetical protein n=1 Tax=Petroclostridium sp. X23 TaxID=3045146 RepID=UPI0024AD34AA|nr:hypothetical protein [Petroclostridium sp. X23]WHH57111.1 hypothetical protein QKW49_14820 [Petroclostridium sp. X23]
MLEIRNCRRCGKIFQTNGILKMCPSCKEQDEHQFDRIREYLSLHPRANMYEVAYDLDISVSEIRRYLKEHRLVIVENDNGFLSCERCGKSIQSGQYCDECVQKLSHGFKVAFKPQEKIERRARFHYTPHYR